MCELFLLSENLKGFLKTSGGQNSAPFHIIFRDNLPERLMIAQPPERL